jgi:hypothetical protein
MGSSPHYGYFVTNQFVCPLVAIERIKAVLSYTTRYHTHIRDKCVSDFFYKEGNRHGCF